MASPEDPAELAPQTDQESIELSIRSTTRPMVGRPTVKNKVARPLIGAKSLVRTPGLNNLQLVLSESTSIPNS